MRIKFTRFPTGLSASVNLTSAPIVWGKAAAPVEFGARLDLSIDENGMAGLEKLSFDAYNESDVLIGTIERYRERTTTIWKESWRIRFTGTVIIWHTVSCMASGYPGRGLDGQRRQKSMLPQEVQLHCQFW